jgi:transposase-like protein
MKILDFYKEFPTEQSCKIKFFEERKSKGITCKKCGNDSHYWKKKREQWECKSCHYRTTLKSGTVMENSKLSYLTWFIAMHLITSTTKSFSAKEVQKQLGFKRYEPVWSMLHKLRAVMGIRDEEYQLEGENELDDGFFETVSILHKNEKLKRGRGSQKQTKVLVATESTKIYDPHLLTKYNKDRKLGFVKMKVIHSFKKEENSCTVSKMIKKGSYIISDGSNSYNDLNEKYQHEALVVHKKDACKMLPWVHTTISNAKRLLLDVHHRIDDDFLQNYLNEFTYKLNRRYFSDLFPRLLAISVQYRWNWLGERYG